MFGYYFQKYKIQSAIVIFMILYVVTIMAQPRFCFDEDGNILQFGLNYKNKTIVPMWLLAVLFGITSYFSIYYYLHMSKVLF